MAAAQCEYILPIFPTTIRPGDTTVPSTIVPCKNRGIYPSDRGIYPMTTRIKLDLCFCTIPTVGFYGKHGEVSISLYITIY